jgi:succinate dehydrogenase flavin-adding protein (antitoxin of CptAB toxin-antitoxin module)
MKLLKELAMYKSLYVMQLQAEDALKTCTPAEKPVLEALLTVNDLDMARLLIAEATGDEETAKTLREWLVKKTMRKAGTSKFSDPFGLLP